MYWKVIYRNETGGLIKKEFVIANDYKEVVDYAEECIKNNDDEVIFWIHELTEKQRRKNNCWIDLRE